MSLRIFALCVLSLLPFKTSRDIGAGGPVVVR